MRPSFSIALVFLLAAAPLASADQCDTKEQAQASFVKFEQSMKESKQQQQVRQNEISAEHNALVKKMLDSKRWTPKQIDSYLKEQLESPEFKRNMKAMNARRAAAGSKTMSIAEKMGEHDRKGEFAQACRLSKQYLDLRAKFIVLDEKVNVYGLDMLKKAHAKKTSSR